MGIKLRTWKFLSAQPFFAKLRTITSASTSTITPSNQVFISSRAASLVFQLASPKSVIMDVGIRSEARASASSGVCLYLKVSNTPGPAGAADLDGFVFVAGGSFFGAGAEGAGAEGGADGEAPVGPDFAFCVYRMYLNSKHL